jgi:UPF0755 protein
MKKLLGVLVLLVLVAGGALGFMYMRVNQPYRGWDGAEQFVEIPAGAGSVGIGDRLVGAGVIRDRATFRTALWMTGQGRHLKAGDYRFDRAMTPFEAIDKVARGDVDVINVTFPEGLTMAEMAEIFELHGLGSAESFMKAAKDPAPDPRPGSGMNDPEKYRFRDLRAPRRTPSSKPRAADGRRSRTRSRPSCALPPPPPTGPSVRR